MLVSMIPRTLQQSSWIQRFFALVIGCNIVLILWGITVVPANSTLDGIARMLATLGMQMVVLLLALFGPLSFQRCRPSMGVALLFGLLFAIAYDGILVSDFIPGINLDVNIWLLFVGAASLAGFIAGYQTRRFRYGVAAAFWALVIGTAIWSIGLLLLNWAYWGSHQWYLFWLNDGAIDDFHRSQSANLDVFLIQDMQGALFFHPLLSAALGAICGLVASGAAQGVLRLQKKRNERIHRGGAEERGDRREEQMKVKERS
jgi:hypothetical protein